MSHDEAAEKEHEVQKEEAGAVAAEEEKAHKKRAPAAKKETAKTLIAEYRTKYEHPYQPAERGYTDDVIMPHDTRKYICAALELLQNKQVARPWKKYSNINL